MCMRFRRTQKKSWHLSSDFDMKWPRTGIHPISAELPSHSLGALYPRLLLPYRGSLNSSTTDHNAQELAQTNSEDALLRVKPHVIPSKNLERPLQVLSVLGILRIIDDHIINVHLHRFPNERLENFFYQPLVCDPCTLQPKRHNFVAIQPPIGYKGCLLLVLI